MRPSKDEMFMEMALAASRRSTCRRLHVGCVITNEDGTAIVSIGYNGNARGLPNDCDAAGAPGNCGCLHAEENALLKAPYDDRRLTMYTTYSPCPACAKRILNSRVCRVVFLDEYRMPNAIMLLKDYGIEVVQLTNWKGP